MNLVVIGLCSGLLGRAASHAVEGALLVGADDASSGAGAQRKRSAMSTPKARGKETDAILKRDVFCSGCVATVKGPETTTGKPGDPATPGSNDPVKTTLQIELVSTMVSDDPAWSMAVLRDVASKEKDAEMFNRGKKIFATTAVVKQVNARRVLLDHEGKVEYIDLDDKIAVAAAPAATTTPASGPSEFGDLDKQIVCTGNNCTIDRALIEKALANTASLMTMARIVPSIKDGKPVGSKIYAVKPGSLFAKLGLQNGDTLKQINGNDLSSPDQALQLYTKLRSASHISLQVERRGETTTMDYTIKS